MLTENQKQILKQIAERRLKEGRSCHFETRAHFNRLMEMALFADRTMTRDEFLREASHELAKHLQNK